jgi:hypothetical protein
VVLSTPKGQKSLESSSCVVAVCSKSTKFVGRFWCHAGQSLESVSVSEKYFLNPY